MKSRVAVAVADVLLAARGIAATAQLWTVLEPDGRCVNELLAVATTPGRVYAQATSGLFRCDDTGLTWTAVPDGLGSGAILFVRVDPMVSASDPGMWAVHNPPNIN